MFVFVIMIVCSPPVFSEVRVTRPLVLYIYLLKIVVCPFVLFLLAMVLSILLRYTDSDYPFGISNSSWIYTDISQSKHIRYI